MESLYEVDPKQIIVIRYLNYRGEEGTRRILPRGLRFVSTEWHPEPQWIMDAFDLDRKADRSFALKDILEWNPSQNGSGEHEAAKKS